MVNLVLSPVMMMYVIFFIGLLFLLIGNVSNTSSVTTHANLINGRIWKHRTWRTIFVRIRTIDLTAVFLSPRFYLISGHILWLRWCSGFFAAKKETNKNQHQKQNDNKNKVMRLFHSGN